MSEWILITGSSKGVGKGITLKFVEKGYNVIIHGRDAGALESLKKEILKKNAECEVVIGDLKENETLNKLTEVSEKKDIILLINNAAVICPGLPLDKLSIEKIEDMIETNLVSLIKLTKNIYEYFIKRDGGCIININSMVGLEEKKYRTVYAASKFGLTGFTRSLRLEAIDNKVKVLGVYITKINLHPEDEFGIELKEVCSQIFDFFNEDLYDDLILDGRPEKFRGLKNEDKIKKVYLNKNS